MDQRSLDKADTLTNKAATKSARTNSKNYNKKEFCYGVCFIEKKTLKLILVVVFTDKKIGC